MSKLHVIIFGLGMMVAQDVQPLPSCACNSQACRDQLAIQAIAAKLKQQYDRQPAKAPNRPPPQQLAPKLLKGWQQHKLHPSLVLSIISVESNFNAKAVNRRTHDYGLMQINNRTAASMGINQNCLEDWQCNLQVGLVVAAWAQKRGNVCRYNVGNGRLVGRKLKACNTYLAKLAKAGDLWK